MKGAKGSLKLLSSSTAMLGSLHVVHPTPTECAGGGGSAQEARNSPITLHIEKFSAFRFGEG